MSPKPHSSGLEAPLLDPRLAAEVQVVTRTFETTFGLVGKLHVFLQGALTALAAVAGSSQEHFQKYYDALMTNLKAILMKATDKANRMLHAKSIECLTLVGMAVGYNKFKDDAKHGGEKTKYGELVVAESDQLPENADAPCPKAREFISTRVAGLRRCQYMAIESGQGAYSISRAVRIPVLCASGLSTVSAPKAIMAELAPMQKWMMCLGAEVRATMGRFRDCNGCGIGE
ncbi:armadillo-type fold protein [Artemisia annua]|uniref:Armadillo-type fold protein n=1 Tax=Artemisia annua TaxID=35608 RepID=A0A2U1MY17_ARTAN|nr:armadillo-type fold protein [Artemisia annua]